jgi:hypothetical protein
MEEDMKATVRKTMQNPAQPGAEDKRKTFRKLADVILEYIAAEAFLIDSWKSIQISAWRRWKHNRLQNRRSRFRNSDTLMSKHQQPLLTKAAVCISCSFDIAVCSGKTKEQHFCCSLLINKFSGCTLLIDVQMICFRTVFQNRYLNFGRILSINVEADRICDGGVIDRPFPE